MAPPALFSLTKRELAAVAPSRRVGIPAAIPAAADPPAAVCPPECTGLLGIGPAEETPPAAVVVGPPWAPLLSAAPVWYPLPRIAAE